MVAALFFWGSALKEMTDVDQVGWKVAADDCLHVLNALLK